MTQHEHPRHDDETTVIARPEFRMCVYHIDHESKLRIAEENAKNLWSAINAMRSWVISGCAAMILTLIGVIVQLVVR